MHQLFNAMIWAAAGLLATASPAARAACLTDDQVPARLAAAPLVIFGELHGTKEAPQRVGDFACWLANRDEPVVLALEIPADDQAALTTYLASAGSAQDRAALLASAFWQRPPEMQDGRSSAAMFDLIERMRRLRAEGRRVAVIGFDGWRDGASPDAVLAENIRNARRAHAGARFVVLVGNLHAIRVKGTPFDAEYRAMAHLLADQSPLTLDIAYDGGNAWLCGGPAGQCAARALREQPATPSPRPLFRLEPPTFMPGFDGSWYIGRAAASPPAISQPR